MSADEDQLAGVSADAARWMKGFLARERWSFDEALLWVIHRDPISVEAWRRELETDSIIGAGFVLAVITSAWTRIEDEPTPLFVFEETLQNGEVIAFGRAYNAGPSEQIPISDWQHVEMMDAEGLGLGNIARPKLGPYTKSSRYWSEVEFDRQSIQKAFPPIDCVEGETASESEAAPTPGPPMPKSVVLWAADPKVISDAVARAKGEGRGLTTRTKTDALSALWHENTNWSPRKLGTFRQAIVQNPHLEKQ